MLTLIKKITPGFLRNNYQIIRCHLQQYFLRRKHSRNNNIGKNIIFHHDTVMEGKCKIADNVIFMKGVRLSKGVDIRQNVKIGRITIGENTIIDWGAFNNGFGSGKITIGKDCYVGMYNVLDFSDNITIGDYVHIGGPSTAIYTHSSANMCFHGIPLSELEITNHRPTAPVKIENNVFIGGNCTIYPGVTIGHHSIIAPNSAVSKDVEPYTLVGGSPAKVIRKLS